MLILIFDSKQSQARNVKMKMWGKQAGKMGQFPLISLLPLSLVYELNLAVFS